MNNDVEADLYYAMNLDTEEAINYFKSKGYKFSWKWYEVWRDAHTVAKIMRQDIQDDIRSALRKAFDEGQTVQQFERALLPILKAKGWWGRTMMDNAEVGQFVQLGSLWLREREAGTATNKNELLRPALKTFLLPSIISHSYQYKTS